MGRLIFQYLGFVVNLAVLLFGTFPKFFVLFLWSVFTNYSGYISILIRYLSATKLCSSIGRNVYFGRFVVLKNMSDVKIGKNVSIHDFCYIDGLGGLRIGDNVSVAHQSSIITFNHTWSDARLPIKYNPVVSAMVTIEEDVWIGCGVRIMPGVIIGPRSVVAAGAVVTEDVPAGTLVAGVPAKVIRRLC